MLMGEEFVNRNVLVSLTEVGGFTQAFSRASTSGDSCNVDAMLYQTLGNSGSQGQLDTRRKTPWVSDSFGLLDDFLFCFRKSIYKTIGLIAEICAQIDDDSVGVKAMSFQKRLCL